MAKKMTSTVKAIVEKANNFLRLSADSEKAERKAVSRFVMDVLHDNNMYRGFNYLTPDMTVNGNSVGLILDAHNAHNHVYPDDSRIYLYVY